MSIVKTLSSTLAGANIRRGIWQAGKPQPQIQGPRNGSTMPLFRR